MKAQTYRDADQSVSMKKSFRPIRRIYAERSARHLGKMLTGESLQEAQDDEQNRRVDQFRSKLDSSIVETLPQRLAAELAIAAKSGASRKRLIELAVQKGLTPERSAVLADTHMQSIATATRRLVTLANNKIVPLAYTGASEAELHVEALKVGLNEELARDVVRRAIDKAVKKGKRPPTEASRNTDVAVSFEPQRQVLEPALHISAEELKSSDVSQVVSRHDDPGTVLQKYGIAVPGSLVPSIEAVYKSREGQGDFRRVILNIYSSCAVTGCSEQAVLEAAHIIPYADVTSHKICNGLCLRADIHTLFDLNLITIDAQYIIAVDSSVTAPEYRELHGRKLRLPADKNLYPDTRLLRLRHVFMKSQR